MVMHSRWRREIRGTRQARGVCRALVELPRICRPRSLRTLLALSCLAFPGVQARAQDALDALRKVVDDACDCAAARSGGMDAAVSCTEGPRAFGRLKVASRGSRNDAERAEVAVLERIIETCIANALDHATARKRLGLAALPGPPGAADTVWTQIRVADLASHPAKLVRIHVASQPPVKGLVMAVTTHAVMLRRARRDGGGTEAIPLDRIREAWVMALR